MKKALLSLLLVLLFGGLFLSTISDAQTIDSKYGTDSILCIRNSSIYKGFYDHKNYKDALPAWNKVLEICPKYSRNTYAHGLRMFKNRIAQESDIVKKEELTDSLFLIYDMRIKYFGNDKKYPEGWILGQKGLDIIFFRREEVELGFEILSKSVELMGNKSKPPVILTRMQCARQLFKMGLLDSEQMIDIFSELTNIADFNLELKPGDKDYLQAKAGIEQHLTNSEAADCDALINLFTSRYEENPGDIELIKKITQLLSRADCTDSDLFTQATESLYKLEPSSGAANAIGKRFLQKEEYDKAIEYLEYAIELENDPVKKASYNYSLGQIYYSVKTDYKKAREYAIEAIKNNPEFGEPYLLKGNIYVASHKSFSSDEFTKSTVFWVAIDNFARAKSIDPSLTDEANRLINKYSPYFPPADQIFFKTLEVGSPFTVGGWINEKTTIRARK